MTFLCQSCLTEIAIVKQRYNSHSHNRLISETSKIASSFGSQPTNEQIRTLS